jgi:uncharacterized protein
MTDVDRRPLVAAGAPGVGQSTAGRSPSIDALRGFALFGIIIVNAPFFAHPVSYIPTATSMWDALAIWATNAFGAGKFFLIFSFLFGFGFATILARSDAATPGDEARLRGRFLRRLAGLFAFGCLHAVFLFYGDILVLYAMLGLVLWGCRNAKPRTLLMAAAIIWLVAVALQTLVLQQANFDALAAGAGGRTMPGQGYLGGFLDGAAQRLKDLPQALAFVGLFNGPAALAMFLAGLAMGRLKLFPIPKERLARLRRPAFAAFAVGTLASGAAMMVVMIGIARPGSVSGMGISAAVLTLSLMAPGLSFGMAILVLRWAEANPGSAAMHWLAAAGASSLSGYILHSVILGAVFMGWGFGLYGALGPGLVFAAGVAAFLVVVIILNIWKRWFLFGPDEWLLRCFADLSWHPLLRPAAGEQRRNSLERRT